MEHKLLRSVPVTIDVGRTAEGAPFSIATIADTYQHHFDPKSRVSKALETMSPEDIADRLSGGHYFFVDDELVDFRDGNYRGFVHTDKSIQHLVDTIGIVRKPDTSHGRHRAMRVHKNQISRDIILGRKWSDHDIIIPAYKEGGEFNSELHFAWNPFISTINSAFLLWRLICTNGMEGYTSFLNSRIPLINRWEEHLDIANRQIQNKVDGMVTRRLTKMGTERCTVAEATLVAQHAQTRLAKGNHDSENVRKRLRNIANIAHPVPHLGNVYRSNVFEDKRLAEQMPAHLTTFDLFNLATEVRSHSTEVEGSTHRALDIFSNRIIFDRKDKTQAASRFVLPQQSAFSDPDAAFFGTIH